MLNPIQLRTLQTVVRTGSFADAARELGYTGSAVSQQIAALERSTRARLFERSAHGVTPTPLAEFLSERAEHVLGPLRTLEDDIELRQRGSIGRLNVGSFPTAAARLLPATLAGLARSHPGVTVHLDEGEPNELFGRLRSGELDVALVYRYGTVPTRLPPEFDAAHVLREGLHLLAPDTEADGGKAADFASLYEQRWITSRGGTAGSSSLRRLCARAGFDPIIVHRSNDYSVVHGLVAARLGLALVPGLSLSPTPGVRSVPLDVPGAHRDVLVVRSAVVSDPMWEAVLHALRAASRVAENL